MIETRLVLYKEVYLMGFMNLANFLGMAAMDLALDLARKFPSIQSGISQTEADYVDWFKDIKSYLIDNPSFFLSNYVQDALITYHSAIGSKESIEAVLHDLLNQAGYLPKEKAGIIQAWRTHHQ